MPSLDNVTPHPSHTRTHAACAPSPRSLRPSGHTGTGANTRHSGNALITGPLQHGPRRRSRPDPPGVPGKPRLGPSPDGPPPLPGPPRPARGGRRGGVRPDADRPDRGPVGGNPARPPGRHVRGGPHGPERGPRGLRVPLRTRVRHLPGRFEGGRSLGPRTRGHPVTFVQRSGGGAPGGGRRTPATRQDAAEQRPQGRGELRDQPQPTRTRRRTGTPTSEGAPTTDGVTSPGRNPPRCTPAACSADARSRSSAPSPTWTASRSSRSSPSPTGTAPRAAAHRR